MPKLLYALGFLFGLIVVCEGLRCRGHIDGEVLDCHYGCSVSECTGTGIANDYFTVYGCASSTKKEAICQAYCRIFHGVMKRCDTCNGTHFCNDPSEAKAVASETVHSVHVKKSNVSRSTPGPTPSGAVDIGTSGGHHVSSWMAIGGAILSVFLLKGSP